jgi:hypothetical protein
MTEEFERITIRLKPYEQETFKVLMSAVRQRAGYDVPATDVVKSLMGFKTKLAPLADADREILKNRPDRNLRNLAGKRQDSPADRSNPPTDEPQSTAALPESMDSSDESTSQTAGGNFPCEPKNKGMRGRGFLDARTGKIIGRGKPDH